MTHSLRLPVHTGEHVQYDLERLQNQLKNQWTSEVALVNESKANALKIFREIQRPAVKLENCKSFIFQSSMYRLARPSTALLWSASFDLLNQIVLQAQSCWDFSYSLPSSFIKSRIQRPSLRSFAAVIHCTNLSSFGFWPPM